jgi:hypothetical protein
MGRQTPTGVGNAYRPVCARGTVRENAANRQRKSEIKDDRKQDSSPAAEMVKPCNRPLAADDYVRLGNCRQYCCQRAFLQPRRLSHFSPNHLIYVAPRAGLPRVNQLNRLDCKTSLKATIDA